MAFEIDDDETSRLVEDLAERLGTTKQHAVQTAVKAELDRLLGGRSSVREKLEAFWARHPRPSPTGLPADKAFFEELSGEID